MDRLALDGSLSPRLASAGAVAVVFTMLVVGSLLIRPKSQRALPGPPPRPLIGNLLDIPDKRINPGPEFSRMAAKYGDIVALKVFGQTVVVLHNEADVRALFVDRKHIYCDRALPRMLQLMGCEEVSFFIPMGNTFRIQRKLMNQLMGAQVGVPQALQAASMTVVRRFVQAQSTDSVQHLLDGSMSSVMLRVIYGYDVQAKKVQEMPFVVLLKDAVGGFFQAAQPDWLVNFIPILQYIPGWVPGASFKRKVSEWASLWHRAHDEPFNWAKAQIELTQREQAAGTAKPSFISTLLLDPEAKHSEDDIRQVLGDLVAGGADTTHSIITWALLALSLHPQIQDRAREEISSILGEDAVPTVADKEKLPYITAVVKEVFRWYPAVPVPMPKLSREDDEYKGFVIKKGTLVTPNVWHILHDPVKYQEPFEFNPERYLSGAVTDDPRHHVFGFGPRACPGRYLADNVVWAVIAQLLATCEISRPLYDDGTPVTLLNIEEQPLTMPSLPRLFSCTVTPRNTQFEILLLDA
ncbi:cytochrome P450 [Auriculariales sp. MPI-PUGE-AT-0066]|nr:cytochrome P450 [Auriculariales sp. MPI-PUGE-AT-0066]